jgi:hypothetical protein
MQSQGGRSNALDDQVEEQVEELIDDDLTLIIPTSKETDKVIKHRSWVYNFAEKVEKGNKSIFYCRYELKSGAQCPYKVETKKGQTTNIANKSFKRCK